MPRLPTFRYWPDDLIARNTRELVDFYNRGFQGAFKDPEADEELLSEIDYLDFEDAAYENNLVGDGEGKLSLAYECVLRLNPQELPGLPQRTGCCVSRATVNAFAASYAYEVWNNIPEPVQTRWEKLKSPKAKRRLLAKHFAGSTVEGWPEVPNPSHQTFDHCAIYGERGHRGQGANCGTLARAAKSLTGLVPRGVYDIPGFGKYDCSKYSDTQAARTGPRWPDSFRKWANRHHVRDVTGVTSIEAARDALANNYGISVCSGFATGSKRPTIVDSNGNNCAGANRWSGSWAHAMVWLACDDRPWAHEKYGGPLFLIVNSWGASWNSGPRRIYDTDKEIPEGSFWITTKDARSMLRGGGAYVLSNVKGFPKRKPVVDFW